MPPLLREWETDYPGFAAGGPEQSLQIQRRGHIPGWLLPACGRFTFSSRPTGSPSSAPVCALGHLPPGRGKAGRAAQCAVPTAYTEAAPPFSYGPDTGRPADVRGVLSRGPGQSLLPLQGNSLSRALQGAETSTGGHMAPLRREEGSFRSGRMIAALQSGWQPAPSSASHSLGTCPPRGRLSGDRKGRPYGVSSTSTVGSAKPGAEFESHRMQFWGSQAPVGREETQAATQILRAGNTLPTPRDNPRNGGLGESRHWRTKFASAASPSVFWFLFHVEKELAPQGETLQNGAPHKRKSETCPLIRPLRGHLPLSPLAFGHLPLTRGVGPRGEG